ncbi:50S ribosomal protein L11 methyltransferase [Alphaproteobacteria bacterium]|nr:50S ribosomal protein L11 methyltransferase [Alphaproteobacteria bacterium]
MDKTALFHIKLTSPQKFIGGFINLLEDLSDNVSWDESNNTGETSIDAFISNKDGGVLTKKIIKEKIEDSIKSHSLPQTQNLSIEEIPEKNWLLENQNSFPPIEAGPFFIYGSHFKEKKPTEKICLEINAALAFGSGDHATTKGCLIALSSLENFIPKTGLDMGCGSGVLSMGAALFFNIPICAVDIDPFSVTTTKENIKKNHLIDSVTCFQSNGYENIDSESKFDLILCNILAKPLCEMAPLLKKHLSVNGVAILSGLLTTQEKEVVGCHQEYELELKKTISIGEWSTLILNHA